MASQAEAPRGGDCAAGTPRSAGTSAVTDPGLQVAGSRVCQHLRAPLSLGRGEVEPSKALNSGLGSLSRPLFVYPRSYFSQNRTKEEWVRVLSKLGQAEGRGARAGLRSSHSPLRALRGSPLSPLSPGVELIWGGGGLPAPPPPRGGAFCPWSRWLLWSPRSIPGEGVGISRRPGLPVLTGVCVARGLGVH